MSSTLDESNREFEDSKSPSSADHASDSETEEILAGHRDEQLGLWEATPFDNMELIDNDPTCLSLWDESSILYSSGKNPSMPQRTPASAVAVLPVPSSTTSSVGVEEMKGVEGSGSTANAMTKVNITASSSGEVVPSMEMISMLCDIGGMSRENATRVLSALSQRHAVSNTGAPNVGRDSDNEAADGDVQLPTLGEILREVIGADGGLSQTKVADSSTQSETPSSSFSSSLSTSSFTSPASALHLSAVFAAIQKRDSAALVKALAQVEQCAKDEEAKSSPVSSHSTASSSISPACTLAALETWDPTLQMTPLLFAASLGHPEGCRQLTEAGARVIPASSRSPASAPASEQEDGVSMASRAGHEGLAVYLLNVAVAQASHERHKTPPSTDVSSDRVLYPLANAQDGDGFTRAMNAAYRGQTRLVKLLIAAGTDVNIEGRNGETLASLLEDSTLTTLEELMADDEPKAADPE